MCSCSIFYRQNFVSEKEYNIADNYSKATSTAFCLKIFQ